MKNILLVCSSLILASTSSAPIFARSDERPDASLGSRSHDLVPLQDIRRIKLGMTTDEVLGSMRGKPDEQMTPDVWIYWGYQGNKRPPEMKRPALIVFFSAGRVGLIRYSEEHLVRRALAEYRAPAPALIASK